MGNQDGYAGTILYADLTKGTLTRKEFPPELKRQFLGGRGIGVKLVNDLGTGRCRFPG